MVPTSTNDACASVSSRNRDIRPMDRTPTIGQKSSSKKKNTLRAPMRAFRSVTAQTASSSFRQLHEDLPQPDLALELPGRSPGEDPTALDERDLVAELVRLAHVVGRQHDGDALLAAEPGDVRADPHRDVGVEAERRLVEEQELGIVHERLGEGHPLLQPGRQIAVRNPAVWPELAELDQSVDPPAQG